LVIDPPAPPPPATSIKLHGVYYVGNRLAVTVDSVNVTVKLIGREEDGAKLQLVSSGGSNSSGSSTWPLGTVGQAVQVLRQRLLVQIIEGSDRDKKEKPVVGRLSRQLSR
jgi:hypothetical protein